MTTNPPHRIGVCSWSLRPDSPRDLATKLAACGVSHTQLALDPVRTGEWSEDETVRTLNAHGITIISGMMAMKDEDYSTLDSIRRTGGVRFDDHWECNLTAVGENADLARRLGLQLVTLHAGFLPHELDDPVREVMIDRLRQVVDDCTNCGLRVAFETGQETADTLLGVLEELDRPEVGVNFDPANMILYAMGDPVESLDRLAPHVMQIHIKDANPTNQPGTWGSEEPVGKGTVDWKAFFGVVHARKLDVDLVVEREAGSERIEDVLTAIELISRHGSAR